VRDYPLSNDQACAPDRFREEAVATLNQHFTHLLVHADPRVARLDTRYSWTSEIQIPIHHTGYVSQKAAGAALPDHAFPRSSERGHVLVSSGGLDDADRLAALSAAAWRLLEARGATARRRMVIVAGLNTTEARFEALARSLQGGSLVVRGFSQDFLQWMQSADLSISQGGYNTTMNVLETRTRAILAPNRRMIDQTIRAGVMRERGLVDVIDMETITAEQLADRILEALARPRPKHDLSLDGARRTRDLIDVISAATQASSERAA
jgi:predicted glycosyltransferase